MRVSLPRRVRNARERRNHNRWLRASLVSAPFVRAALPPALFHRAGLARLGVTCAARAGWWLMAKEEMRFSRKPDKTLWEPWDDATYADIGRLDSYLNIRLCRGELGEDGSCLLDSQAISLVTRVGNITKARKRLLSLPERSGVSISVSEEKVCGKWCARVRWPAHAVYQTTGTKFAAAGLEMATRAHASPVLIHTNPIQSIPSQDGGAQQVGIDAISPETKVAVDRWVLALRTEETRSRREPTHIDEVQRERIRICWHRVGDTDESRNTARVRHAIDSTIAKGDRDCSWIWAGKIDDAALRWSRLGNGPIWGNGSGNRKDRFDGVKLIEEHERKKREKRGES